ncbi:MAG: hypothetical protein ACN4GT_00790, partial [Gammaproteobacteria bacterium]
DDRSEQAKQRVAATPAKFLYDAVQTIERTFDVEIADFGMLKLNHLSTWDVLDVVRQDMSDRDGAAQVSGSMMVQITTGSSLALSAGILTWVLRGGALASALLSTMPVWQGFDPLPILMARKRRDGKKGQRSGDPAPEQSQADQIFDDASGRDATNSRGRAES